jgi:hypothetical protein
MKRTSRTPSTLSESLQHHLNGYALAASAAGVGLLALAQPAEGKIVYTPAHHVIGKNGYFAIDFNQDGIPDLGIHNSSFRYANFSVNVVGAAPATSENVGVKGGVVDSSWPGSFLFPALKPGTPIGPGGGFIYSKGVMVGQCAHGASNSGPPCSSDRYHTLGSWADVKIAISE